MMPYTLTVHQHRLAAWAASTAASASPKCRFRVSSGFRILEEVGFNENFDLANHTRDRETFDRWHEQTRQCVIDAASCNGCDFTHGVAAKLINCYLKVRYVCVPEDGTIHTGVIHPPIDRLLLLALAEADFGQKKREWKHYAALGWSKFTSGDYQRVIVLIQEGLGTQPLWKIEEFWDGHAEGATNE